MTNPTIPDEFKRVTYGDIIIKKHSIVGSSSVILPNVTINTGASIGALSLVKKDCEEFSIYSGNPAIKIGKRHKKFLRYEEEFIRNHK